MKKIILVMGSCLILASLISWLIWGKLLGFLFTQIPVNQWSGLIKIGVVIIVAWGGGVTLPLAIIMLGVFLLMR